MNFSEFGERVSNRLLADGQIFVIRSRPYLMGCQACTDAESHTDKIIEGGNFIFIKRISRMIASDDKCCNRQRVGFVENRIGDGDGRIADRIAVDHIAKVDDPDDLLVAHVDVCSAADNNVVIICVIVDNTFTQLRKQGRHILFETIRKPLNQVFECRILD